MTGEHWRAAYELFERAGKLPAAERRAFVERAGADGEVVREVLAMLDDLDASAPALVEEDAPRWRYLGQQVGRFQITGTLGRGGMGEVYSGLDQELNRPVALKFLAIETSNDARTTERFVREARAASALNHPNIVTVHDVVRSAGAMAIVMELVDGVPLRQMCRRPNALEQVAHWGVQIAGALAAAHASSIIHRDIKPENVMVRPDGYVKVLDFGLARRFDLSAHSSASHTAGTFRYMSPEQTRGVSLTTATDVFSFGIVLYELATGTHPFDSESPFETAHFIASRDPEPPSRHSRSLPAPFDNLVLAMLAKNPAGRPAAAAIAQTLRDITAQVPVAAPLARRGLLAAVGALGAAVLISGAVWKFNGTAPVPQPVPGPMLYGVPLTGLTDSESDPAFSPDGLRIAYAGNGGKGDVRDIYVKTIGEGRPERISEDAADEFEPRWSPDGSRLAYLRKTPTDVRLLIVPAGGGREIVAASLVSSGLLRSRMTWTPDGSGVIVADDPPGQMNNLHLYRLDLATGQRTALTHPVADPSPVADVSPEWSPDGKMLAFLRSWNVAHQELVVIGTDGRERRLSGPEKMSINSFGWSSDSQSILYSGSVSGPNRMWRVDVSGGAPVPAGFTLEASPSQLTVSGKGKRLAFTLRHRDSNVWKLDLTGRTPPRKLTLHPGEDEDMMLSPDGAKFAFTSKRSGAYEIWVGDADGSNQHQVTSIATFCGSATWSPDSREIAFDARLAGQSEIWIVKAEGGKPRRLVEPPVEALMPRWSRDGKHVYFCAHLSGSGQVWKAPAAGGGAPVRVTRDGGCESRESPDGKYLYYTKPRSSDLWRMPLAGGGEEVITELREQDTFRYWDIAGPGVFFVGAGADPKLRLLDVGTREIREMLALAQPPDVGGRGLSVAPDGKSALYVQYDKYGQEIVVVDYGAQR
ncbi:MAG: serine/threonine-protein kinase [Bryobacterales bacterium]|nr:serine/threonine-protein kinase [Bryobacterales bacterium]